VQRDWAPEPDPALIVDHVRDLIIAIHEEAIKAGQKADGSGPQPPLGRWVYTNKAKTNLRGRVKERKSMHRGYSTGHFVENLTASKITVSGKRYKARSILDTGKTGPGRRAVGPRMSSSPHGKPIYGTRAVTKIALPWRAPDDLVRVKWLGQELARGNEFLFVEGLVEEMVDQAVEQVIDVAFIEGGSRDARMGELRAKEAIHSR
jgi:hypothetical protein